MTPTPQPARNGGEFDVLTWVAAPESFPEWSTEKQLERYRRVLEWHDYAAELGARGLITHSWGSHQLLSRARYSTSIGPLLAIYRVGSWAEFDDLLIRDPLRDISRYVTTPLSDLYEDRETDWARLEKHRTEFMSGKSPEMVRQFEMERGRYNNAPDYVGKYEYTPPGNAKTSWSRRAQAGDPLSILLLGMNPHEYVTQWDDTRKLIHHEKVMWWHDYMAYLIQQKKISHAWGTHDFCFVDALEGNSAAAVGIYEVETYDEFDTLYRLDPIRTSTLFWSVLLQPIADQRAQDELRYSVARSRSTSQSRTSAPVAVGV